MRPRKRPPRGGGGPRGPGSEARGRDRTAGDTGLRGPATSWSSEAGGWRFGSRLARGQRWLRELAAVDIVREVAFRDVARRDLDPRGGGGLANVLNKEAAGAEPATARQVDWARELASDRPGPIHIVRVGDGDRGQQGSRVWMGRMRNHLLGRRLLDDPS